MKGEKRYNTYALTAAGITAAAYAVLTIIFAPISYGAVQLRLAEALCVLPCLLPCTSGGLFVGCLLANLFSGNALDIVFGSLATLSAGILTSRIGKRGRTVGRKALSCVPPILLNGLTVGAVITKAYNGLGVFSAPGVFALNAAQVAAGEAIVLFGIGLPILLWLPKKQFFTDLMAKVNGGEKQ